MTILFVKGPSDPGAERMPLPTTIMDDPDVSWDAKGLYCYLWFYHGDKPFSMEIVEAMPKCGRDKAKRIMGELRGHGYVIHKRGRDESGRHAWSMMVLDQPESRPIDAAPENISGREWTKDDLCRATNGRCGYCGRPLGDSWEADHIFPRSLGGGSYRDNFMASCHTCNAQKSDRTLEEYRSGLATYRGVIPGEVVFYFETIGADDE